MMKTFLLNKKRSMFIVCFVIIFVASVFVFQAFALNGENGILVNDYSLQEEEKNTDMASVNEDVQEENEVATSQENVTSKDDSANTQNVSSQKSAKIQRKNNTETTLKLETASQIAETANLITVNILGKDVSFEYVKSEKPGEIEYDINELSVYKNGNTVLKFDSKTNKIMSIDFNNDILERTESDIPKETVKKLAVKFAEQYCDLSKYNECVVSQYLSQYSVVFRKTINGLTTPQYVVVDINKDLSIASFERAPDMFDAYDLSKITVTEQDVIQLLYDKNKDNEKFNCKIHNIIIMVKDSKLQAEVCYWELDEQGNYINEHAIAVDYIAIG